MTKNKLGLATLGLASTLLLAACGGSSSTSTPSSNAGGSAAKDKFSVVFVTDSGGVDDKSFNQSAWEGFQAWGKETKREKGVNGYDYIQSTGEKDYATNFSKAIKAKYDLIYAVGFQLNKSVNEFAEKNPDQKFVAVDATINENFKNGASLLFAEQEAAYLAGIAAARTTQTNHIGYIGGIRNATLIHFESGFIAGAKSVNKDIVIENKYVESFQDAPKGKTIADTMYAQGVDVIYAAAGTSGLGVFSSAKEKMEVDDSKKLWVIGVDMDQHEDGNYKTKSGETKSVTLTSTLKLVGQTMKQFALETEKNGFKTGVFTYRLKDGGVDLTNGQLSEDIKKEVQAAKEKIISGEITPPATDDQLKAFLEKN
ncbi:BMP family protein [Carnobacteriaceae bacterium zg-ZUI252]|nr:BMP family protein [Carnobacteriaceae bacterium zg-ZUI252]